MKLRACSLLLVAAMLLTGCAVRHLPSSLPSLPFEEHTLRLQPALEADGSVSLARYQPLAGKIGLRPILEAEGLWPASPRMKVQILVNYGRFYVAGDGFRSIWEISPSAGASGAAYRPVILLAKAGKPVPKGVRLSRYGLSESSCLRVDWEGGDAVYVTRQGKVHDHCP